jgi:hypothetical protein
MYIEYNRIFKSMQYGPPAHWTWYYVGIRGTTVSYWQRTAPVNGEELDWLDEFDDDSYDCGTVARALEEFTWRKNCIDVWEKQEAENVRKWEASQ